MQKIRILDTLSYKCIKFCTKYLTEYTEDYNESSEDYVDESH